jgi:hypothetical protein
VAASRHFTFFSVLQGTGSTSNQYGEDHRQSHGLVNGEGHGSNGEGHGGDGGGLGGREQALNIFPVL